MTAPAPRVVCYVRVSGGPGQGDGERQVADLTAAAGRNGWTTVEIVREVGSGAHDGRPGLKHLLEVVRSGTVDAVAVTELSRLSRGGIGSVFEIVRTLDASNVRILSLSEPWVGANGPTRDLMLAILAWAVAQERAYLIERTRSGVARAKAQGKQIGRRRIWTSELVAETRRLRAEGLRWAEIARKLHHPAASLRKWSTGRNTGAGESPSPPSERSGAP